jgi:hypothetical protein
LFIFEGAATETNLIFVNDFYELQMTSSFYRAGVIPFIFDEGEIHVCLAYDEKRHCYSDFGGGREKINGVKETIFENAARELREESATVFDFPAEVLKEKSTGCIFNDRSITFFMEVNLEQSFEESQMWFLLNREHYVNMREDLLDKLHLLEGTERELCLEDLTHVDHYLETDHIRWFTLAEFREMMGNNRPGKPSLIGGLKKTFCREVPRALPQIEAIREFFYNRNEMKSAIYNSCKCH